ncbi:hypothetical protein AB4Y96_09340 [Phyllobacterium sp. TAF24]|uniref:hypothetical protein n=1 Tax=Phyllobacterium sp. TAF24 TaxID=3233068 RepID=UPI003F96038A
MRSILFVPICILVLAADAAALPKTLTAAQLVDVCSSSTVSDASGKGDHLGWQRMSEADTHEWRTSFLAYNGGTVDAIGWRRGEGERDGSLSFWIATGPNAHKACMYSVGDPTGLLDDLTARLGTPNTLDKKDFGATASWKQGSMEGYYSQTGQSAIVSISYKN